MKTRRLIFSRLCLLLFTIAVALATACVDNDTPGTGVGFDPDEPQPDPEPGQTRFVSADYRNEFNGGRDTATDGAESPDTGGEERVVEEGDIYRVLGDRGLVANVNYYRGLQLIDVSDPAAPAIVGGVRFTGDPVEMYTVGDRAYSLVNNGYGYFGAIELVRPSYHQGGSVIVADVSSATAPTILQQLPIDGAIRTSRLVREGAQAALYVVATDFQTTYVQSFELASDGTLTQASRIELGGSVTDAQATPTRLLVARHNNNWSDPSSTVTVIDISDPTGDMVQGASVTTDGYVESQFNMDVFQNVLRVVSTSTWGSPQRTNHVETFDITDISNPLPLDSETFGDGEDLYATLFRGNKAFFVTYEVVDPFHAFEIASDGTITERSQFIVSGWNDFFKPAFDDRRLVGVGIDDREGFSLAVSLYDITDLDNPSPLVARKSVDLKYSWSEASWDHRAFTVLEDATSVQAGDGTLETGLILLPFSGWDDDGYASGVQIFTFSETTVTVRGQLEEETPVRRSFQTDPDADVTATLSDTDLGLFDIADPDGPIALGSVSLAPNYTDVFVFETHAVRRRDRLDYYWWWYERISNTAQPYDVLEVVALPADGSGDVDLDAPVATVDIPVGSSLYQVGTSLVGVQWERLPDSPDNNGGWQTTLTVYDFSNPASPSTAATLETRQLPPPYNGGFVDVVAIDVASPFYRFSDGIRVVGDALVFPEPIAERRLEGVETITYTYPAQGSTIWSDCWGEEGPATCTYYTGTIVCRSLERADGTVTPQTCTGAINRCTQDTSGDVSCTEIEASEVETTETTYSYDRYRYWTYWDLHVVDLTTPATPELGPTVSMGTDEEAQSLLTRGENLYVSFRRPTTVAGDARPFVRYYFREIDYANPQNPISSATVNIPGELVEVDGNLLVTRDWLWADNLVETTINRLSWQGSVAVLDDTYRFDDAFVAEVRFDGADHVLATHRASSWYVWGYDAVDGTVDVPDAGSSDDEATESTDSTTVVPNSDVTQLTILDLSTGGLDPTATVDVDAWATLRDATAGRGLFAVPGGMLVMNLDDAAAPYAQAYFALRGWPQAFVRDDRDLYFAAGRFGIYRFDLDAVNLLPPQP